MACKAAPESKGLKSPQKAAAAGAGPQSPPKKMKMAKASLSENPLIQATIVLAAVAIGTYFGLEHKRKGMDVLGNLLFTPNTDTPQMTPARYGTVLSKPVHVRVFANGDSANGRDLILKPGEVEDMSDLKRLAGKHINGCTAGACRVFNEFGIEVFSPTKVKDGDNLFLVLPDRLFIMPGWEVGHKVTLNGVSSANDKPLQLTTLSLSPRVFSIDNFFSADDADELIRNALAISEPDYMLKRSLTGTKGEAVSSHRTSENAFDTSSPVAMKLKRRVFELLGIRPYDERWADGLQVLRYNKTKAYIPHLDYLESIPGSSHDFASEASGSNRFATVLLYLTDVEEGGETVFISGKPLDGNAMNDAEALDMVRKQGLVKDLTPGSWEEEMTAHCRSRLAVKPKKAAAALFYSQHPDGRVDEMSMHGGCPVLSGTKWAANLWVWNGPRYGSRPLTEDGVAADNAAFENDKVQAEFSSKVPGVQLFWQDSLWGDMGPDNAPQKVNTYRGHVWNVRKGDDIVHTFKVKVDRTEYVYEG